jgi:hypothetical protein
LVVAIWFLLVFFYDLGLLGLLVVTDGAVAQQSITALVVANPAGLFRMEMMQRFAGPDALESLGIVSTLPSSAVRIPIWLAWTLLPLAISGALLLTRKATQ